MQMCFRCTWLHLDELQKLQSQGNSDYYMYNYDFIFTQQQIGLIFGLIPTA